MFKIDGIVTIISETIISKSKSKFDPPYFISYLKLRIVTGMNNIIIPIFIKLLMHEYINPLLILPTVIKKSNTIISNAKKESTIKKTPNWGQPPNT